MQEKLTYNVSEAAKVIGVSRSLMYQLVKEEKVPSIKLGNRILISKIKLEEFINN